MLIEYKYKWQTAGRSFAKLDSIDDVIDWLKRFDNYTLEDYIEIDNIDEIRITIKDSPIVVWFQLIRKADCNCSKCNQTVLSKEFEITLIFNDYPIGKIFSKKDLPLLLKQLKDN